MRRPLQILGCVLALVCIGWLISSWLAPAEPRYQGRRVSDWFKQYYRSGPSGRWNETERAEAISAIRAMGTNALPFLLDECVAQRRDSSYTNLLKALASLPNLFPPYVPGTEISHEAAEAVGIIRPPAVVLLPWLKEALASPDQNRRQQALNLLGYVGDGAEATVPLLVMALRGENPFERALAAQSLAEIGESAKSALPALVEFLERPASDRVGLHNVCRTLGDLEAEATNALPALRWRWQTETDPEVRLALATAICRIAAPEPEVLNSITAQLDDTRNCFAAIQALGQVGANARMALPALQRFVAGTNYFKQQAAEVVRQIESAPASTIHTTDQ